jgi:RNA polymerase sigma-B factor
VGTVECSDPRARNGRCRRLGADDLAELHRHFADHRCARAADSLIDRYGCHARALARRFYRGRESLEDLEQVAFEALLRALERFDVERGIPFVAFAEPSISGTLKRFYRDRGWGMLVPRWVHELTPQLKRASEELRHELGREPTIDEIADRVDVPRQRVEHAMGTATARETDSLDVEIVARRSPVGSDDRVMEAAENRIAVHQVIDLLDTEDRQLVSMYFDDELTQSEIGARIGVSQVQVSRQLRRVVDHLRTQLVPA